MRKVKGLPARRAGGKGRHFTGFVPSLPLRALRYAPVKFAVEGRFYPFSNWKQTVSSRPKSCRFGSVALNG